MRLINARVLLFFTGLLAFMSIIGIVNKTINNTMTDFSNFDSLLAMTMYFNNEKICKDVIAEVRLGKGEEQDVVCPYCGGHHFKTRNDGKYRCNACGRNFSCKVGTIFEDSNLSLVKWFIAMYLISSHKKGISSFQLSRDIHVSQKTAWYMFQKIRCLYKQDDSQQFSGVVECDEVYIGGKEKWKHKSMKTPHTQGRSTKTKTPVFGMVERTFITNANGEKEPMSYVHAFVVEKTDRNTLQPIIGQFVAEGSTVMTDELNAYRGLENLGYDHAIVCHGAQEFVNGDIFTNGI